MNEREKREMARLVTAYEQATPAQRRALNALANYVLTPGNCQALELGMTIQESLIEQDAK